MSNSKFLPYETNSKKVQDGGKQGLQTGMWSTCDLLLHHLRSTRKVECDNRWPWKQNKEWKRHEKGPGENLKMKDSVQSEHFCGVLRWKGKRSGRANVTPRLLRTEGSSLSWQRPQPGAPPDPCQLPSWAVAINSRGCGLYPQFSTALITVLTANTVLGIIQNTLTD